VTNVSACGQLGGCMEEASLRVPGQGHHQADSLSLRSAERRLELLHDVVSLRSERSRRRPRSGQRDHAGASLWQRFKEVFRTVIAFVFSNVGICVLVLGYLILGAFIFQYIEEQENLTESFIVSKRNKTVMKLWNITERYNTLHLSNWSSDVVTIIAQYQTEVIAAAERGFDGKDIPDNVWNFSGALLYSLTVITTIGYGHIVPKTPIGKMFTIFYAVIGIPLFLLYLSNIGQIFATSFKWTYSRLCKCQILRRHRRKYRIENIPSHIHPGLVDLQKAETAKDGGASLRSGSLSENSLTSSICSHEADLEDEEEDELSEERPESLSRVSVPISLSIAVMITYICGGAILFGQWEHWVFLDGFYFCFISLTTIGFGDLVPGDSVKVDDDEVVADDKFLGGLVNLQFIFVSLYIIFGMAIIAMCFSLMQEKVVRAVIALGRKIGLFKGEN